MTTTHTPSPIPARLRGLLPDLRASLVVFLVALPLCVGVAVASGAPAELGIVTGIVGGLVAGALPGSSLQVSGPAAGLTVLVADAVAKHGLAALGVIVAGAGVIQIALGVLRLGTWFQAISPAVVQGMLAGIGLVLILGQLYPLFGDSAPSDTIGKLMQLPSLLGASVGNPASVGLGLFTLGLIVLWNRLPSRWRAVPGPLVAVVAATAVAAVLPMDVSKVRIGSISSAFDVPGPGQLGMLTDPAVLGTMLTIALVASAESLFSAVAVDRMHEGRPTRYNAELVAQGAGNMVSGALGALPMTAVIVRSSANVHAGARTRASAVLHGVWLLVFAFAFPGVLGMIPLPVLAALLIHAGWKLLEPGKIVTSARRDRAEAAITVVTALAIAGIDMLTGVLAGLALAIVLAAWRLSHVSVDSERHPDDTVHVRVHGNATFLRLPQILSALDGVPHAARIRLDLTGLRHLDHATRASLEGWATRRQKADAEVHTALPAPAG